MKASIQLDNYKKKKGWKDEKALKQQLKVIFIFILKAI
jgi:hypothetical protein